MTRNVMCAAFVCALGIGWPNWAFGGNGPPPGSRAGGVIACEVKAADLEVQLAQVRAENASLGGELSAVQEELGTCQSELGTAEAVAQQCTADLVATSGQLSTCAADLGTAEAATQQCTADLVATAGQLSTCDADLGTAEAATQQCAADLVATAGQLSTCDADLNTAEAATQQCAADLVATAVQLSTCDADLNTAEAATQLCAADLDTTAGQLSTCATDLGTSEATTQQCDADLDATSDLLSLCEADLDAAVSAVADCPPTEDPGPDPDPDPPPTGDGPQPFALYSFEGDISDSVGDLDGVFVRGSYTTGYEGQALHQDATCSQNYAARVDGFPNLTGSFSVEAWVRPNCGTWQGTHLVDKWNLGYEGPGWFLMATPMPYGGTMYRFDLNLRDNDGAGFGVASEPDFVCNQWYHVVAVRDKGTAFHVYVDGELVATAPDTLGSLDTFQPLTFLGHPTGGCGWGQSPMDLDEVALYDTALTAEQVGLLP